MAFSINRATLVGNISQSPDLKYTPKGTAVLKFGFATNHSIKNQDGSYTDIPTFHNIVVWARQAEGLSKVLHKGQKAYIEGRIENRSYIDKDNNKKYISEIVADSVIALENKKVQTEMQTEESTEYLEDLPSSYFERGQAKAQEMNENLSDEELEEISNAISDTMDMLDDKKPAQTAEPEESNGVPF